MTTSTPAQAATARDEDEFTVYNLVINEKCIYNVTKPIVIQKVTAGSRQDDTLQYIRKEIPEIDPAAFDDFVSQNRGTTTLKDNFNLKVKYLMGDTSDFGGTPQFWVHFYERYPDVQAIVHLSRVGFNHEMDKALVYFGRTSGAEAGIGYVAYLGKEKNVWHIIHAIEIWAV